jgi:hypothetical protein
LYLGNSIFFNTIHQEFKVQVDPFRPLELTQKSARSLIGAPAKLIAKPRKPSRIFQEIKSTSKLNTPSVQKRQTNQIRNAKRGVNKKVYYNFYNYVK